MMALLNLTLKSAEIRGILTWFWNWKNGSPIDFAPS